MKLAKLGSNASIIIGLIMVILGIVFLLQSKSVVGPSASFMYSNPVWTVNGSIITGTGLTVVAIGVITRYFT
jgi:protein-S-isoprenylcysteine O-methyltransferase Ste14